MKSFKILLSQKSLFLALILVFLCAAAANAQKVDDEEKLKHEANVYINKANEALGENDFAGAEAAYRKAIAKDPTNTTAKYNMGNLYYNREKSGESQSRFSEANQVSDSKEDRHRINHNLGNALMKQKKYQEAINAYKNALRNNPSDDQTRYNLALAKKKLEEEKQDQDQNQDQDQDQDQENKDQDNKDQDNQGDKGDDKDKDGKPEDKGDNKDQDPEDGEGDQENEKPEDQKGDNEKPEDQNKKDDKGNPDEQKKQQQQPAEGQLSPQQIQSLLKAMNNEEEKVQDKMNAEKAKGVKTRSDKDW